MEQLHIVPFNNKKCHVESNLDNEDEEGESDNDPTHDYQLLEENQLLITGFDRCVESKMASLMSASEASSSADASSTFIGSPPSLMTGKKKKGKKLKKSKGI
ncbi:hypothetical protein NC651_006728 [Populus alba x Populus x berolinensis]|nr:hypothetical protein NC651_006728 [Populus alba x Populus x berolinensis]